MASCCRRANLLIIFIFLWAICSACRELWAREPWEIQHPAGPPPSSPFAGGAAGQLVPKIGPDFWRQIANQQIPYGTVFPATLEQDISSKTSKAGDTFTLLLNNGYWQNGLPMIPPASKITGTVHTCVPAAALDHGNPGRLDISLQNLVFPDGRALAVSAFIEHNPAADPKDPKACEKVHFTGTSFKHYGSMFASFFRSFTRGIGSVNRAYNRGLEFKLAKGTLVFVRLTASLNIPQPGSPQWSSTSAAGQNVRVPGLAVPDPDVQVLVPASNQVGARKAGSNLDRANELDSF